MPCKNKMEKELRVKIDIGDISVETYEDLIFLFREKFGKDFYYDEWEITARKTKE